RSNAVQRRAGERVELLDQLRRWPSKRKGRHGLLRKMQDCRAGGMREGMSHERLGSAQEVEERSRHARIPWPDDQRIQRGNQLSVDAGTPNDRWAPNDLGGLRHISTCDHKFTRLEDLFRLVGPRERFQTVWAVATAPSK